MGRTTDGAYEYHDTGRAESFRETIEKAVKEGIFSRSSTSGDSMEDAVDGGSFTKGEVNIRAATKYYDFLLSNGVKPAKARTLSLTHTADVTHQQIADAFDVSKGSIDADASRGNTDIDHSVELFKHAADDPTVPLATRKRKGPGGETTELITIAEYTPPYPVIKGGGSRGLEPEMKVGEYVYCIKIHRVQHSPDRPVTREYEEIPCTDTEEVVDEIFEDEWFWNPKAAQSAIDFLEEAGMGDAIDAEPIDRVDPDALYTALEKEVGERSEDILEQFRAGDLDVEVSDLDFGRSVLSLEYRPIN